MPEKRILAINPGSKYLALSVFEGADLRYWGIKVLKGKFSKEKIERIKEILSDFIDRYGINILAIKKLHHSRSSSNLKELVRKIKEYSKRKGLKVYQYSLKEMEDFFSPGVRANKRKMAERVVSQYPFLNHSLQKEKENKNPYFIRMFEAIALGMVCLN